MSRNRQSLESWIQEALTDPEKDGKITMMTLAHMVGQQPKEIHSVKFGPGKAWGSAELASMLRGKAESYAQDLPGVQTFNLMAFYGGRNAPEAYHPFLVNQNFDNFGPGLSTEAANEQGRMQQSMRHSEMLIQQVYRRQQVMDDYTLRLIAQQGATISQLAQENRDCMVIVKDMMMERALNDHKFKMEQLAFQRASREREKWLSYAPPLINTILGRELFPASTADTVLVESIAEAITEEDIMKISSVLKPELWGPLASRFHQVLQKKAQEREANRQLMPPIDPEADAAGDVG